MCFVLVQEQDIEAAQFHRCNICERNKGKPKTHKVSMPKLYQFNYEVGLDVLEIEDTSGRYYDILNTVDYGFMLNYYLRLELRFYRIYFIQVSSKTVVNSTFSY